MGKWLERGAIAAAVIVVAVVLIGMYATWRDCSAAGGTTVRGLFGLECIKGGAGCTQPPQWSGTSYWWHGFVVRLDWWTSTYA